MNKQFAHLIVVSLVLSGCVAYFPERGPVLADTPQPTPRADMATVYIYRAADGWSMHRGEVNIYLDEQPIFSVIDYGCTWIYVKPGSHKFTASWPWISKPLFEDGNFDEKRLVLDMEAGKNYFINYKIEKDTRPETMLETSGLVGKALSESHYMSVDLISENEEIGKNRLRNCSYQENRMNQ